MPAWMIPGCSLLPSRPTTVSHSRSGQVQERDHAPSAETTDPRRASAGSAVGATFPPPAGHTWIYAAPIDGHVMGHGSGG